MTYNISNSQESNISIQNRLLIPPIVLGERIFYLSNPKFFLVLYKIGKLAEFMLFVDVCGYDEVKNWLKKNHLLEADFLENVSLYSVFCKIKHARRLRFFVKNSHARVGKFDLN